MSDGLRAACAVDVLIIGGGIAGAGAAFEIAAFASVVLVERENACGYHSTGRSAASFSENYGVPVIRRLAIASRDFLAAPPVGFCAHPLLRPRGMLTIARSDQLDLLEREFTEARRLIPSIARIDAAAALARVPILRAEYVADAFLEPGSQELDVDALLQGFLRGAKRRGAQLVLGTAVETIERVNGTWLVTTQRGSWRAKILVNAAGAWADSIAAAAGLRPLGLQPKRRTAFTIPMPPEIRMTDWPLVTDVAEQFYFKPDAGRLFVSPADATPSPPVDAHPEDLDVAEGVLRLERATTLDVRQVSRSWAGLRTFAPDGNPIVGPDPECDAFIWLAGQGGSGIKTSPALSRACASLIQNGDLPQDFARLGIGAEDLSPARAALEALRGAGLVETPDRSESGVAVLR